MPSFIDTHNHLGCDDFNSDRDQVIKNSIQKGVIKQIVVSVFANEWQDDIELSTKHTSLHVACGIHPMYIPDQQKQREDALALLRQLYANTNHKKKLCALGEIGLDYYIDHIDKALQQAIFQEQLAIASHYQRPVLLHVRRAHADTIKILKQCHFKEQGIAHAFSGSYEEAKEYIKLGFKIGLGGAGTYPHAYRMHRVLQQLPLESIVLETDAPDLSPVTRQGMRNSPEYLPEISKQLAIIKQINEKEFATVTTHNACKLFNWSMDEIKKTSFN